MCTGEIVDMLGNKWIKDVESGASKQEKRKIRGYSEGGQRVGGR